MKKILLTFCLPLFIGVFAIAAEKSPPNIVYILADDLGWMDLGCQGSQYYETPNIDRLASQGMRLTRYYNSQNCAPTRAALMSGQYAPRTGVYSVESLDRGEASERRMNAPKNVEELPLDKFIFPQALKKSGYTTGIFGKWHLGREGAYHPSQRGFDEAIVSDNKHFNFETTPKVEVPKGTYFADFITDRSVDFIERHQKKPFFLYVPHFAVHTPIQAKADYIAAWEKKPIKGTHWDPTYAAMIQSLDECVGRIVAKLEGLKLTENTIVIFSSDNGGVGGYGSTEAPSQKRGFTDNAPLRGGKGTLYEGGIRVPFIVRWPGVVKPNTTSDVPLAHVDIYPTFLEIGGGKKPSGQILDGKSFVSVLKRPAAKFSRDPIYWHFPGYLQSYVHDTGFRTTPVGVIHSGDFKLLEFFEDNRIELYNLREDISEKKNLAVAMPKRAKELRKKLAAWRKEICAEMPRLKKE